MAKKIKEEKLTKKVKPKVKKPKKVADKKSVKKVINGNLTDEEVEVLYKFVDTGNRRTSYKDVFGEDSPSDKTIYRWYYKPEVQAKIIEIGNELSIFDTVCDKTLLGIIIDTKSANRDKINAINSWNSLRERVHHNVKVSVEDKIDFSNVSDENLESIVEAIKSKEYGQTNNSDI